jgi:hypothetical protein
LSISTNTNGPREITFRWRTRDDDKRDAEAERLLDEGKLIEHAANLEPSKDRD